MKKGVLAGLAALLVSVGCAVSVASEEAGDALMPFQIAAQPLDSALVEFSRQSGLQLVVTSETVRGKSTRGVRGRFTPTAALTMLLEGLGLEYSVVNSRSLAIRPAGGETQRKSSSARAYERTLVLAQAGVAEEADNASARPQSSGQPVADMPELLVRGRRSINADIQRTEDNPLPYVVFGSEEIQRSQALNLEDFLKYRLPMNAMADTASQGITGSSTVAVSGVDLRGLGTNQTLILVDGRRLPGMSLFGNPLQSDINGIPLDAIERIEVLPSTAGGIYGGSATGGVINIIMRKDYAGVEASAVYNNTFDTDAGSMNLSASAGFGFEGGRTRVLVTATQMHSNILTLGDRDFAERGVALQRQNNPAAFGTAIPLGGTVNIQSALIIGGVRQPLVLDERYGETPLNATFTHVRYGYAGPESDGGAALVANAGTYNLDLPTGLAGRDRGLMAAPGMRSGTVHVSREFSPTIEAFVDFSSYFSKGTSPNAGAPSAVNSLPADAPNNPFQQPINVRFPSPDLSFDSTSQSTMVRAVGGLIARLPMEWTAEADLSWNRSRLKLLGANSLVDSAGLNSLQTGQMSPDGRPALNALQEANTFPIDYSPYLLPVPNHIFGPFDTVLKSATVRLSGPALSLPEGQLWLTAMAERRTEEMVEGFITTLDSGTGQWAYEYHPSRSQDADSLYLEARAPLLARLELQVSGRHDRYRTRAGNFGLGVNVDSPDGPLPEFDYQTNTLRSTDYTVGLRYEPTPSLALRASYGTGFLPPSVAQIVSAEFDFNFSFGLQDPKRGHTDTYVGQPYKYIYGGYPDLKPEQSESLSMGVILKPRLLAGLRISADYTRIRKIDEVQTPEMQLLLDFEDALPGRIMRGEKLPGDPADWAGPITAFNLGYINIANTTLEAVDIQADYLVETARAGELRWYVLGTWTSHFRKQALPSVPELENVGYLSGPLKWRGNFGVDWTRGDLSIGWNAQYFGPYIPYFASSSNEEYDRNFLLSQGASRLEAQIFHDLLVSYRFGGNGHGLLSDTRISVGIQNVLNTSPAILAVIGPLNGRTYSPFGDPRMRRYSISIRRAFGK